MTISEEVVQEMAIRAGFEWITPSNRAIPRFVGKRDPIENFPMDLSKEIQIFATLIQQAAQSVEQPPAESAVHLSDIYRQLHPVTREMCVFKEDENGPWTTSCGETFYTEYGDSASSCGWKFCCYCGKPIDELDLDAQSKGEGNE